MKLQQQKEVLEMVFERLKALLFRESKVIVSLNCNAPEKDDEYIQIEANGTIAE